MSNKQFYNLQMKYTKIIGLPAHVLFLLVIFVTFRCPERSGERKAQPSLPKCEFLILPDCSFLAFFQGL